jgi:DNA (cytosine-5)-methyltransferase 1
MMLCEIDSDCRSVLARKYPASDVHDDISSLKPPRAEVVSGGWPCQDISVAGLQAGLAGVRSGLLFELLRVARESRATTLIAENVANLLRMRAGEEFQSSLYAIHDAGFPYIGWRVLNARQFGLPQHRTRLLIIASKEESHVASLFRQTPEFEERIHDPAKAELAAGFYWTAGTHSINYSRGYVPTVKVGSSLRIPSPPAVHYADRVRLISAAEALALQGFDYDHFDGISKSAVYRMAGNAVARPMGAWLFSGLALAPHSISELSREDEQLGLFGDLAGPRFSAAGVSLEGQPATIQVPKGSPRATNLVDYLDLDTKDSMSKRAASGLLSRLDRSGQLVEPSLMYALRSAAEGHSDA